MEPQEKVYRSRKKMFIDNFIGGIAWSIGATVGLTIIVFVLSFSAEILFIPMVGDFVAEVTKFVLQKNPQLLR